MKILFIEPPGRYLRILGSLGKHKADFLWPPFDHMFMAGYLRRMAEPPEMKILDARDTGFDSVRKEVRKFHPDYVVFNTCVTSIDNDCQIAQVVKEVDPDIVTVITGQVLNSPEVESYVLDKPEINFVITDPEPEYALRELIGMFFAYERKVKKVTGLSYKEGVLLYSAKHISKSPKVPIDELGTPAYDLVDTKKYHDILQKRSPFTLIYGSRGCRWGKCVMCSCPQNFQPLRVRNPELVIHDLEMLSRMGIKELKWWDAEINHSIEPSWYREVFGYMKKMDFTWQANLRADFAPLWLLELMKEAGCHHLSIGLESANKIVLEKIKKGIVPENILDVVSKLKAIGIDFSIYTLCGLPGETLEALEETKGFIRKLGVPSTFGIVVPNPATEFHSDIVREGRLNKSAPFSSYDTNLPPVFRHPNLTSQQIYETSIQGRRMLLSPLFILKTLLKIRSPRQFLSMVKTGMGILKRTVTKS